MNKYTKEREMSEMCLMLANMRIALLELAKMAEELAKNIAYLNDEKAISAKPNCKECIRHNNTTFFMGDMDDEDDPSVSADRPTIVRCENEQRR